MRRARWRAEVCARVDSRVESLSYTEDRGGEDLNAYRKKRMDAQNVKICKAIYVYCLHLTERCEKVTTITGGWVYI